MMQRYGFALCKSRRFIGCFGIAGIVYGNENGLQTEIEIAGRLYYIEMHAESIATVIFGD